MNLIISSRLNSIFSTLSLLLFFFFIFFHSVSFQFQMFWCLCVCVYDVFLTDNKYILFLFSSFKNSKHTYLIFVDIFPYVSSLNHAYYFLSFCILLLVWYITVAHNGERLPKMSYYWKRRFEFVKTCVLGSARTKDLWKCPPQTKTN